MIVNSNRPHTWKQYMATFRTPSESTIVFGTVFRKASHNLNEDALKCGTLATY